MNPKDSTILSIVVPCYNEEEVLKETAKQLTAVIDQLVYKKMINSRSTILFVDDGSKDTTWSIIQDLYAQNQYVKGLKLAHNVGHQNALFAGLMTAKMNADCVLSIDADLQDNVNVIEEFILKYKEGYDVVYGVRKSRKVDTFFKRNTALGFYKMMELMGVDIVYNHADYRLLSKRFLEHLAEFKEVNLFLRGIVPLIGFKSAKVYYDRRERFAGESKYPLKKMISFAFEGITSFSVKPLRFVMVLGFILFIISILAGGYAFVSKLMNRTVSGWTSLMLSLWFIGGVQLMSLGLIGEYIGKIYKEVKKRPRYIIETNLFSKMKE